MDTKEPIPLKVLIVEDSEDDAALLMRKLQQGGFVPSCERVETGEAFQAALASASWEMILCDYKLPRFSGLQALALYKESGLDIPFLVVSGNIGEDTAVEAMRAGAHDYIMKDRLQRLIPAIKRELKEAEIRRERRRAEAALEDKSKQLHDITKEHVVFLENLRQVETVIRQAQDLDHLFVKILDLTLELFDGDRAWLLYPCDPEATTFRVPMIRTREQFPVSFDHGADLPVTPETAGVFRALLEANEPVAFDPQSGLPIPWGERFNIRSQLVASIHPRQGRPWIFGIHQCSYARTWSLEERRLFNEISRRLSDVLSSMLYLHDLEKSEARYRRLFDNAALGIFQSTPEGKMMTVNHALARMFGYESPEEVLASVHDAATDMFADPERRGEIIRMMEENPEQHVFENHYRRKDGTVFTGKLHIHLVRDKQGRLHHVEGLIEDITEKKLAEEALKKSEQMLADIIRFLPDATFIIDADGRVIYWNLAMERLSGVPAAAMLGKGDYEYALPFYGERRPMLIDLVRNPDPEEEEQYLEFKRTGDILSGEAYTPNLRGRHAYLSATAAALRDAQGKIIAAIECIRDATERKQSALAQEKSIERIRRSLSASVKAIYAALEARDPATAGHQQRVADLARAIATELQLSGERIEGLRVAGMIHDIGKLCVPSAILNKPAQLTEEEFRLIKEHPQAGHNILKDIEFPWPIARMILQHHERLDGTGYPLGLKGEEILLEANILSVAEAVETMVSNRPYRPAVDIESALEEISRYQGIFYVPEVVAACVHLFQTKRFKFSMPEGLRT